MTPAPRMEATEPPLHMTNVFPVSQLAGRRTVARQVTDDSYSSGRGGIVVGVRREFSRRLLRIRSRELSRGRALAVEMQTRSGEQVHVVSLHLDPSLSLGLQHVFLRSFRTYVDEAPASCTFLVGDWNFVSRVPPRGWRRGGRL